jgi:hypothetical protein
MFGLNPYVLIGAAVALAISFGSGFGLGHKLERAKFDAYKLEQSELTRKKEAENQSATDQIRRTKDAKIADINNKLVDAISELHKRPARPAEIASNGQSCSGRSLYAEDAVFLTREAARADIIRSALEACYNQYDKVADAK